MSNYDVRIRKLDSDLKLLETHLTASNKKLIDTLNNHIILHENIRKENKMLKEIIVNLSEKIDYSDDKIKKIKEEIIKDNFE